MFLFLLFLCDLGRVPSQRVDLIEFNSVYDECTGELKYEQFIFRDHDPQFRRHDIVGWVMAKNTGVAYSVRGTRHIVKWDAGPDRYEIEAPLYKETHFLYDPERVESKTLLHESKRAGLRPFPRRAK